MVCVFTLPAVTVGWYQKGHPCSYLLDDFNTQALVITQHDRVQRRLVRSVVTTESYLERVCEGVFFSD